MWILSVCKVSATSLGRESEEDLKDSLFVLQLPEQPEDLVINGLILRYFSVRDGRPACSHSASPAPFCTCTCTKEQPAQTQPNVITLSTCSGIEESGLTRAPTTLTLSPSLKNHSPAMTRGWVPCFQDCGFKRGGTKRAR